MESFLIIENFAPNWGSVKIYVLKSLKFWSQKFWSKEIRSVDVLIVVNGVVAPQLCTCKD